MKTKEMSMHWVRRMRAVVVAAATFVVGCGPPPSPKEGEAPAPSASGSAVASASPSGPPATTITPLRTGRVDATTVDTPLVGTVAERGMVDGDEVSRIELSEDAKRWLVDHRWWHPVLEVEVEGEEGPSGAIDQHRAATVSEPPSYDLWVRRRASTEPLKVTIHVSSRDDAEAGMKVAVSLEGPASPAAKPQLAKRWAEAVARQLRAEGSILASLAANQLLPPRPDPGPPRPDTSAVDADAGGASAGDPFDDDDDELDDDLGFALGDEEAEAESRAKYAWSNLMRLAHPDFDGEVWSVVQEFRPNVPLSALTPLSVVHHPWAAMTARLPAGSAKAEPLARLTPAAFYYLRTDDVAALFALLDEADDWGAPLWRFMEGTTKQRQLVRRYRTLLGLPGSELAKRLGPTVIERLAVVGSDPFLRQGSDVTVIVEVKNASLFGVGLSRELEAALAGRGEPKRETVNHHGVPIAIVRSSDGAVEQHRASVGSVEVISTSRGAIERVLDTIAGRHPNLAAEADFQFMLRRDHAVPNTILAYAGERFIDNAVSPRSRILDARRQIALAELEYLGHVALLFGRIHGRAPTSRKELLASKLLEPSDLRHFDRAPIAFEPGSAPRSSWGTPARLTAIIDLPDPTRVTKIEQLAYASYAEQYGGEWLEAPDPVALRIAQDGPSGRTLRAMLRVLPVLPEHIVEDTGFLKVLVEQRTEDYLRLVELTGDSPVPVGVAREGEEVTFAISKDSSLRQQLQGLSQAYVGERLSLDWLGDRVAVGVLDRPELANAMATLGYASQMPSNVRTTDDDVMAAIAQVPLYANVAVKSRAAAVLAITALRAQYAADASFQVAREHRNTKIVRADVDLGRFGAGPGVHVVFYYALSDQNLYVALHDWVIEQLLDDELEAAASARSSSAQVALSAKGRPNGGLVTAFRRLTEDPGPSFASRRRAEALLIGAPTTRHDAQSYEALSLAYFGSVPLTLEGRPFQLDGTGAFDPLRGNDYNRRWPALPIDGSPSTRVISALEALSANLRFDREPTPAGVPERRSIAVELIVQRR